MPRRHRLLGVAFIVIALIIGAAAYSSLPADIPSHWNAAGEIDDTMPRFWGVLFMPLVMLGMLLMFEAIIWLSPQGFRLDQFKGVVGIIQNVLLGFLLTIYIAQILIGLGKDVQMERVVMIGTGLLFILMGNYLGKIGKNFFIGIRTPWTLASDEVWVKTHRLAGWLFVLVGAVIFIAAPFGAPVPVLVGGAVVAALVPTLYSLLLYKRLEGFSKEEPPEDEL